METITYTAPKKQQRPPLSVQQLTVLQLLRQHGELNTAELQHKFVLSPGKVVSVLKAKGYPIVTRYQQLTPGTKPVAFHRLSDEGGTL
ncbi:hypothetical protein D5085_02765 [Ectothiorhodospiraceae bacterium BW-2]|nr:hypothetical protein D5085_02765 [Ectothiorhodospiraceae bacterium BW-2]